MDAFLDATVYRHLSTFLDIVNDRVYQQLRTLVDHIIDTDDRPNTVTLDHGSRTGRHQGLRLHAR